MPFEAIAKKSLICIQKGEKGEGDKNGDGERNFWALLAGCVVALCVRTVCLYCRSHSRFQSRAKGHGKASKCCIRTENPEFVGVEENLSFVPFFRSRVLTDESYTLAPLASYSAAVQEEEDGICRIRQRERRITLINGNNGGRGREEADEIFFEHLPPPPLPHLLVPRALLLLLLLCSRRPSSR